MPSNGAEIEPKETAIRLVYTLFFVVIVGIVEAVLGVVVCFSLVFTLLTKRAPSESLKRFANRTISYLYHILRYATYNETSPPFPFAELPCEIDPVAAESNVPPPQSPVSPPQDHPI